MTSRLYGISILVTFLLLAGCSGRPEGTSSASGAYVVDEVTAAPPKLAVEALIVSSGSILQQIEGSGTVRGINEATVVSETQGIIIATDFDLGEFVEAGRPLAAVDDSIARLSLEEATAAYESAQLDLGATQKRYEAGSASQAELTRARSGASGAEARLQAARKSYRDRTVRAPISGYVASRGSGITVGNFLQPGVPVARIVDLSSLRMDVGVGEQELRFLQAGAPARVDIPACGQTGIPARVESIAAGSDDRTGSFTAVIVWENTCGENARSGISASVTIDTGSDSDILIVPGSAIRTIGGEAYLFVANGEVVERRNVVLGEMLGDRVQVLSGIRAGEVIVVTALTALGDGSPIEATVVGRTGDVL